MREISAQREPIVIRRREKDVDGGAVGLNIGELQRFCDRVGAQATARGLTEEKLAEILADDN